jgi:16S rRNA (cytosine967-C5)-methyltransferase
MPVSPARATAFDILLRVEQADAYASELLHASHGKKLSQADHGLATELVMGVLRWRSLLDQRIAAHSSLPLQKLDAEVLTALRLAAYQLKFLERVPQRAAVHQSVELVKRARKRSAMTFANAVLRKMAASAARTDHAKAIRDATTVQELSGVSAHPVWLIERWSRNLGFDAARNICEHDQTPPETTIRLGPLATYDELERHGIHLSPGRLLSSARRVQSGDITSTEEFRHGQIVIQDEASQLVALLVGRGMNILDCCAAPGGKTRLIAERNPNAAIIALELHPHRARTLRKLVPAKNVKVIAADARQLPISARFDRILVDAPCSGTGTLARNPEIKWQLSPNDLADLPARQLAILQSAMQRLQPGGRLVYSTCSLEPEENSEVVESALAADGSFHALDCHAELELLRSQGELACQDIESLVSGPYLRTIPGLHPCEGFFAAAIGKRNGIS